MTIIQQNLQQLQQRISAICKDCNRDPADVTLLAVSKSQPVSKLEEAIVAGQTAFGENYVQEGMYKIQALAAYPQLIWHFIGPLQSNKTRLVAENFSWCHTIDRLHIARRLSDQRPIHLAPLNILIQVNISAEPRKSGIMPDALPELAREVSRLPRLRLQGVMAIPAAGNDYQQQLTRCQQVAAIQQQLRQSFPQADTLSLGMSNDLDAAVTAGSTLVRIGTAIFGARGSATALHIK